MQNPERPGMLLLMWLFTIAPVIGGSLSGTVTNEQHQGIPGIKVFLIDEFGFANTAITNAQGAYLFYKPKLGSYTLRLEKNSGFIITKPACGTYETEIQNGQNSLADFEISIAGVSVDFGRPAGGGTSPPPPFGETGKPTKSYVNRFAFAMKIANMQMVSQSPQRFVLTGYFHEPSPNVHITIEDVVLPTNYQENGAFLSFQNQGSFIQVIFDAPEWPYMIGGGDVLIFQGTITSQNGRWSSMPKGVALCFCVQNLTFFYNNQPTEEAGLAKFSQPWGSCFSVNIN